MTTKIQNKNISKILTITCVLVLFMLGCSKKSDPQPGASTTTPTVDDRDLFVGTWNWDAAAIYPGAVSIPFYEGMTITKGTAAHSLQIAFASSPTTVINGTLAGSVITFVAQTVDGASFSGIMTMTKLIIDVKLTSAGNGVTTSLIGSAEEGVLDFENTDLFEGTWRSSTKTVCSPGATTNVTGTISITSTSTKNQVTLNLPAGPPGLVNATVSGKGITIPTQKVAGYTFQGSIALTGSILTNTQALSIIETYSATGVDFSKPNLPTTTTNCTVTSTAKRY